MHATGAAARTSSAPGGASLPPPEVGAPPAVIGYSAVPRAPGAGHSTGQRSGFPCWVVVEVTLAQCGLLTNFGRKVTGVIGGGLGSVICKLNEPSVPIASKRCALW